MKGMFMRGVDIFKTKQDNDISSRMIVETHLKNTLPRYFDPGACGLGSNCVTDPGF